MLGSHQAFSGQSSPHLESCVPPVRFLVWFDCAVFQFDLSSVIFVFLPAKTLDIEAEGESKWERRHGQFLSKGQGLIPCLLCVMH
jgi:hypothetical protein